MLVALMSSKLKPNVEPQAPSAPLKPAEESSSANAARPNLGISPKELEGLSPEQIAKVLRQWLK